MLNLIDSTIEKVFAQEKLEARLQKTWRGQEKRVVIWRPDSRRITVHHNDRYWYGLLPLGSQEISIPAVGTRLEDIGRTAILKLLSNQVSSHKMPRRVPSTSCTTVGLVAAEVARFVQLAIDFKEAAVRDDSARARCTAASRNRLRRILGQEAEASPRRGRIRLPTWRYRSRGALLARAQASQQRDHFQGWLC
ncbi:hypothetical protein ACVW17_003240 [Bradyrhizobium sp. USDA 4473]